VKLKLEKNDLEFAFAHIEKERDTDLYPRLIEHKILMELRDEIINKLESIEIGAYHWKPGRRFLIPKTDLSYRIATQLDPLDSIYLAAIIHKYGSLIEETRRDICENRVYSYRFKPTKEGLLYDSKSSWNDFWKKACEIGSRHQFIAHLDIADFYNQIYHHTVENQLIECEFPNETIKTLIKMLGVMTQSMSRGIPIGPHSSHILAEATLIPLDNYFADMRYDYCRYVDDIVLGFNNEKDARIAVFNIANQLDTQQRLILQKSKTKIHKSDVFINYASKLFNDEPQQAVEKKVMEILNRHSGDNPYALIDKETLEDSEYSWFEPEKLKEVIDSYLGDEDINYSRIRWFYRRLAQLGVPTLFEYSIINIEQLIPALSDISFYMISAAEKIELSSEEIGSKIIDLMDSPIMKSNEFFQLSLLSVFKNSKNVNNIHRLISIYSSSSASIKRIIILAAFLHGSISWIREQKEKALTLDPWSLRAYIIAVSLLPADERKYLLKNLNTYIKKEDILEEALISWSNKRR
jgi:hypothetical protein